MNKHDRREWEHKEQGTRKERRKPKNHPKETSDYVPSTVREEPKAHPAIINSAIIARRSE